LQAMPIASNAFDTVCLDIVGEIIPSSAEGHRWILTMIDSATRFFIAVPMKKIDCNGNTPQNWGGIGVGSLRRAKNLQYLRNGAR